jgi:hypothetical protein
MWKKTMIALTLITLPTCQAKTYVQENTTPTQSTTTSKESEPYEKQQEPTNPTRQIPTAISEPIQTTTTESAQTINSAQTIEEQLCSMDWNCEESLSVAWCESRMNPQAISPINRNGSQDFGLMQINNGAWQEYFGERWAQVLNAEQNIAMAYEIYSQYGWQPWTCAP